ncbi:hypothetical protein [Aureitalea marina]|nr:hypothetical protein [Aureitalea marina]
MATGSAWMDQLPDDKGENENKEKEKQEKEFILYSFLLKSVAPWQVTSDNYNQFDSRLTIGIKKVDLPPPEIIS